MTRRKSSRSPRRRSRLRKRSSGRRTSSRRRSPIRRRTFRASIAFNDPTQVFVADTRSGTHLIADKADARRYRSSVFVRADTPDNELPELSYHFFGVRHTTDKARDFIFEVHSEGERRFQIMVTIIREKGQHELEWRYSSPFEEYRDSDGLRVWNKYALALRSQQNSLLSTLSPFPKELLGGFTMTPHANTKTYTIS